MANRKVLKRRFLEDGRLELTLDNKEKFVLDPFQFKSHYLDLGAEIPNEIYQSFFDEKLLSDCRKKASDLLFRRLHSRGELRRKLRNKQLFSFVLIDKVLEEMTSYGYLDDKRFAELYCKELSKKGFGPRMVSQKMRLRGLESALVQEIIQEFTSSELDTSEELLRLAQKKLKSLHREVDQFKKRQKLYRYLAGRGWGSGDISKVIAKLL
ncbi:regulatory protein RecX [Lentisphaera profundi]|uniref:Regulatory protein RecX n=1 Tax=Lentisphaera profundi TaxID=1658616 RepID=A0ABY7VVU3_9BACT|nr:regulatory protein RecX [Lentisphaera profundi]WDE96849.1 regulatory protein RecX [Lentisphaera profundi]